MLIVGALTTPKEDICLKKYTFTFLEHILSRSSWNKKTPPYSIMEIVLFPTQSGLSDLWPLLAVCKTNIDFGSNFSVNDISFHGNLVSKSKPKTCSWFSDQLLWKAHKEEFKVGQRSTKSSRSTCSRAWKPNFRWGDITLLLMLIYVNWTLLKSGKLK